MTISAGEKAAKCERCDFLPDPSPYSPGDDALDGDGLCQSCAHVMAFASFVQTGGADFRWQLISDLFEAINDFDGLDAEKEKAEAAKVDA
jgi:hypothetical protein